MLLVLLICELQTLVLIVHKLNVLPFSILVLIKEEQTIDEQVCILQFIVLALIYETFTVLEETVLHVNNEVFVLLKEQFLPYANDTFVTEAVKLAVDISLPTNDDVEQHTYIPREQDNFDTFMFAQFNKKETLLSNAIKGMSIKSNLKICFCFEHIVAELVHSFDALIGALSRPKSKSF